MDLRLTLVVPLGPGQAMSLSEAHVRGPSSGAEQPQPPSALLGVGVRVWGVQPKPSQGVSLEVTRRARSPWALGSRWTQSGPHRPPPAASGPTALQSRLGEAAPPPLLGSDSKLTA